jgi:hypothetical protein
METTIITAEAALTGADYSLTGPCEILVSGG